MEEFMYLKSIVLVGESKIECLGEECLGILIDIVALSVSRSSELLALNARFRRRVKVFIVTFIRKLLVLNDSN